MIVSGVQTRDENGDVEPSKNAPMKRPVFRWWPTAAIALSVPFLVWFAIGEPPTYASYRFGPYEVGPDSGYFVVGPAATVAAAGMAALVIRTRRGVADLQSWAVVVVLAIAGALGAAGWRGLTASYSGADIGGGVVELMAPLMVAGLLVGAVWIAGAFERATLRRTWLLTVVAALVAPGLYAVMYALSVYDASAGLITAQQYGDVRLGQTRAAVHERLGREGTDDYAMFDFPPAASGLLCDHYTEISPGVHTYRFCFRSGMLVSKHVGSPQPLTD
jgi:hypothetical protein